jgi:hypothetical protein
LIFNFDGRLVYFLATNPSSNLKRKNKREKKRRNYALLRFRSLLIILNKCMFRHIYFNLLGIL